MPVRNYRYDPDTGVISRTNSRRKCGSLHSDGYIQIEIDGTKYLAHRLAWFLTYGVWVELDHRDLDKANNRLSNLRPATHCQNMQNRATFANNTSGVKGLTANRGGWQATVKAQGIRTSKWFKCKDTAATWLITTRQALHGEFQCEDKA